jgi:hypothetical protein
LSVTNGTVLIVFSSINQARREGLVKTVK